MLTLRLQPNSQNNRREGQPRWLLAVLIDGHAYWADAVPDELRAQLSEGDRETLVVVTELWQHWRKACERGALNVTAPVTAGMRSFERELGEELGSLMGLGGRS